MFDDLIHLWLVPNQEAFGPLGMLGPGQTPCQASFTADMPSDEWTRSEVAGGVWFTTAAGDFANSGTSEHRDGDSRGYHGQNRI